MLVLILVPVRCILKYISSNMRQQWAMQLIAIFRQWLLPANAAFLEGRTGKVMGPLGWGPVPWRPSRVTISVPRVREGLWDLLVCLDSPEIPWVLGCLMRVWSFLSPHSTAFPFPSPRPYLNVLLRKTKLNANVFFSRDHQGYREWRYVVLFSWIHSRHLCKTDATRNKLTLNYFGWPVAC